MDEFPPDLLESFRADVCPDITGQFGCGQEPLWLLVWS